MTVDTFREEPKRERHPHEISEVLDFDPGEYLKTADNHDEAHTVASHSDTTATGAELETLTDGSDADALHAHPGIGGDVVYSDNGDTSDIDISEVTDVTIKTTDVTGVSVGDVLIAELVGTFFNDRGSPRLYVITPDFDAQYDPELTQNVDAHATAGSPVVIRWMMSPAATNEAFFIAQASFNTAGTVTNAGDWVSATLDRQVHDLSTADLTGTITVALKIRSASATANQGFRVLSFVVRKVSST